MELPEQDKQAFIEAARRRTQPQQGGAAFGVYPSSGKRPEKLNVSRDVNMPAQAARGWVAGTLGLPGDIESLGRMALNFSFGPGGVNVDETPVLPTSEFYQEWLPGGDERPAAKFASGLGALTGGAGSTKVAGTVLKGAKATGKALGPKAAEMAEGYLQRSGLAPTVVKPKGGNWLSGSVEGATQPLKTHQNPAQEVAYIRGELERPQRGEVYQQLVGRLPQAEREDAINNWIDTKLNKYIRNEMGTPEDPVRKLAERDVLHVNPEQLNFRPEMHGRYLAEGQTAVAQSPTAKTWEGAADLMIQPTKVGELLSKDSWLPDLPLYRNPLENNPWLEKVSPDTSVYALSQMAGRPTIGSDLGFDHLIDELRNATRADSDLPANLRWKPEDLKKVTMEQAVERVAKINDWRAAQMEAAKKAAREGIPVHKEYEGGFQWMAAPDTAKDPKSLKYIQDVGCESGWCTQGESLARQYGGGGNQLYVLHDPNGKSVVQISVRPQAAKQGFVGNQRPSEADYYRLQEEWLEGNRVGIIDPNLTFAQWWRAKEGIPEPDLPPEIVEIKGRQNRPPKEEHLPMVQDFVRSGNWSRVGDFKNTGFDFPATGPQGIFDLGDIQRLNKAGIDVPKYLTRDEAKRLQDKLYEIDTGKNPETGYAKGGLVQDTDAIAAKLTGMDKDKALTHALRMANAKQEAHMAAGGLAKVLKGAKKAEEATKAAKATEKAAEAAKPAVKGPQAEALETARKNAVKMLGLPENNTAMDRAKALGFDTAGFRGSSVEETAHTKPIWWSEDPEYASAYAAHTVRPPKGKPDPYAGNVMPLLVKEGASKEFERFTPGGVPLDPFKGFNEGVETGFRRYAQNEITGDLGGKIWEGLTVPKNVRSRFAAFDPARVNENDLLGAADPALLAGTAVASGIGLGALGQMSKPKPKQEEKKKAAGGLAKRM